MHKIYLYILFYTYSPHLPYKIHFEIKLDNPCKALRKHLSAIEWKNLKYQVSNITKYYKLLL